MRTISGICIVLLGFAMSGEARQLKPSPNLEVAVSAGLVQVKPDEIAVPHHDSWYPAGRYAGSLAYYWSRHIKAEYEYAWSQQRSRYVAAYNTVAGQPYPYYFEDFHQLQQHSLRLVYQFRDNQWVHPWVSAGAVLDVDRHHAHIPITYQPSGRGGVVLVHPGTTTETRTNARAAVSIGGGAKFYMSERAFFNAGAIGTVAKPSKSVSLLVGVGVDF
jgi:hypothetical protein